MSRANALPRLLLLLLPVIAVLSFIACSSSSNEQSSSTITPSTSSAAAATTAGAESTSSPNCPPPSKTAPEAKVKTYPQAPPMTIDPSKKYTAVVHTVRGDFTIELRPDLAPKHVNSFVFLAKDHYFDGVTFHRVLPGFVAQTGDPTGTGTGSPGYTVPAEFTNTPYDRGVVGMARTSDPNSAGSQWFIAYTREKTAALDGQYTVFGMVTQGMDVVDCITPRDPQRNPNAPAGDAIVSIDISEG